MPSERIGVCTDVLATWNFSIDDCETSQEIIVEDVRAFNPSETNNGKRDNPQQGQPSHIFANAQCPCMTDVVALVRRLETTISSLDLGEFTAFLPRLRNTCGSNEANLARSLTAMDWFVHRFGPNILRAIGNDWMATELENTPRTVDFRTLDRAVNACSGATYFLEGACSHVFHAGYQAGEALLELAKGTIRSTGNFGRALGGAVAAGESIVPRRSAGGEQTSGGRNSTFSRLMSLGWNDLVLRLLEV